MKYNININQKAIVDLGLKDKVDFIDLAIFDCICAFAQTNICTKIIIGDETYFLIKASLIKEQLPLLGISTDRGINKRIDNLIECGLIERCPQNKSLKHPYYKLGNLVSDVLFTTWNNCSKSTMNDCSKSYIYINNNTGNNIDNDDNNKDNKIEKDNISIVESDDEFAERMYKLYPTKCPVRGVSLGNILGSEEAVIYGIDPNVWYTMDEKAKNYHRVQPQKKEKLLKWIREHDNG